jgi:hypothetical protein
MTLTPRSGLIQAIHVAGWGATNEKGKAILKCQSQIDGGREPLLKGKAPYG